MTCAAYLVRSLMQDKVAPAMDNGMKKINLTVQSLKNDWHWVITLGSTGNTDSVIKTGDSVLTAKEDVKKPSYAKSVKKDKK